jgi:L-malate glycosyltransferase
MNREKKYYVLHAMGMESSKYGGLERFMIQLAKNLKNDDIGLILVYNTVPWSKDYVNELNNAGVILVISHAMRPFTYMKSLIVIFRRYKPTIVHTHFQNYYSIFFSRLLGCKRIYSFIHGMLIDSDFKYIEKVQQLSIRKRFQKYLIFKLTHQIFTISDAARIQYNSLFPYIINKTLTFYLGVLPNDNLSQISRNKLKIAGKQILIGTICFNSPVKGLDVLLNALSILKHEKEIEEFKLVQIGIDISDPENEHYIIQTKQKSIEDNIIWIGIIDNVNKFLPGLDIYCQPSRSEALGLSVIEAGMAGLPVVGSRVGGIPEIIDDGDNGFLFESENSLELAEKLYKLIKNRRLRNRMGTQMKKKVEERFNIHKQTNKLVDFYKDEIYS